MSIDIDSIKAIQEEVLELCEQMNTKTPLDFCKIAGVCVTCAIEIAPDCNESIELINILKTCAAMAAYTAELQVTLQAHIELANKKARGENYEH